MRARLRWYREVWCVDFEFATLPGSRPVPRCLVARELFSGHTIRQWLDGHQGVPCPLPSAADRLFVAYYASAELGCYLALKWPVPRRILDLYAEFRWLTSGRSVPCGHGLLGALTFFGLDGISVVEKEAMRQLARRGGPYTPAEQAALLDYCQTDVEALAQLLPVMLPHLDMPRALLRGRYMAAAARIEWQGIPLDRDTLTQLQAHWGSIQQRVAAAVNRDYPVFLPVGQRPIDAGTPLGAALLRTAAAWDLDPYQLAEAVDYVWKEEWVGAAETRAARAQARQRSGLTVARIQRWESAGYDAASWRGLDEVAEDLAMQVPALGIGPGIADAWDGAPPAAARLWSLLRDPDTPRPSKQAPHILRHAVELAQAAREEGSQGPLAFSARRFATYLGHKGLPWPRLQDGTLALDDDTFREMAKAYPHAIGPIREVRSLLSHLRLRDLAVGSDGRNRCLLSAFGSRTGRNQPSNSRYIFGPSCWLRSLIQPGPGQALAMSIGASKNSPLRPICRTTRPCWRRISPAIFTWPLPNWPGWYPQRPRKRPIRPYGSSAKRSR